MLSSPTPFAQLQLRGLDAFGEDSGTAVVDTDLLMEVMEKREFLEDSPSPADVAAMRQSLVGSMMALLSDLSTAFKREDTSGAQAAAIRLQYFSKLLAEVENWESSRGQRTL